jgi:hypothetical protein
LAITGLREGKWNGLSSINKETGGKLKISTMESTYKKVLEKLKKYCLLHYENPL